MSEEESSSAEMRDPVTPRDNCQSLNCRPDIERCARLIYSSVPNGAADFRNRVVLSSSSVISSSSSLLSARVAMVVDVRGWRGVETRMLVMGFVAKACAEWWLMDRQVWTLV